ncbi:MAG TPA: cytochrome c5 family protein, partial [Gammaproteobacteria bacterium]|nr:cytochrome c5 family protein [Gammaproteobacteria bacterium]
KSEPAAAAPAKAAEPAALAPAASETAAASSARSGEEIFNSTCTACHSTGAAGAPKVGDKEAWAPRIATGMDTMLEVAIKGRNAMPPRGTCGNCSDDELKAAIEYMVSKSQ